MKLLPHYVAQIQVNRSLKYLGCFDNPEKAAYAYDAAARQFFGEFGRFNFPKGNERSALIV